MSSSCLVTLPVLRMARSRLYSSLSTISATLKLLPVSVPADDDKPEDAKPDEDKPIDDKSDHDQPSATANDAMVPLRIIKTTVPAVSKGGTA